MPDIPTHNASNEITQQVADQVIKIAMADGWQRNERGEYWISALCVEGEIFNLLLDGEFCCPKSEGDRSIFVAAKDSLLEQVLEETASMRDNNGKFRRMAASARTGLSTVLADRLMRGEALLRTPQEQTITEDSENIGRPQSFSELVTSNASRVDHNNHEPNILNKRFLDGIIRGAEADNTISSISRA